MVLLNVLDESWVVKLCRVIAAGRQIAVRQEKASEDSSELFSFLDGF